MPHDDADLDALIESAAKILDLPLTDAYRPGILVNLRNLAGLYEAVLGLDVPESPSDEVGPFRP